MTEPFRGRYSASQITTFRTCARKWAWDKIEGKRQPENKYAERGKQIHSILEAWLEHGTPIDTTTEYGAIAASGVEHLPPPGTSQVEQEFYLRGEHADYLGYVDCGFIDTDKTPVILDHKTTSNLSYAKTAEDLLVDPQAMIYAKVAFDEVDHHEVELRWVYYLTTGAKRSKKVSLKVVKDHVEKQFAEIEATAAHMNEIRVSGKKAKDLPPNPAHCSAYGGCPYVNDCSLTSAETMKGWIMHETWMEKMKKKQAGTATSASAPVVETTATEVAPTEPKPAGKLSFAKKTVEPVTNEEVYVNPPEANLTPEPYQPPAEEPAKKKAGRPPKIAKPQFASKLVEPVDIVESEPGRGIDSDTPIMVAMGFGSKEDDVDNYAFDLYVASFKLVHEQYDDEHARAKRAYSRAEAFEQVRKLRQTQK